MKNTLYYGGPIHTMEDGPMPAAVLTQDGRVRAVGAPEALSALAPGAERRDLNGAALLPAFIDPHSHFVTLAGALDLCPLDGAESPAGAARRLKEFQVRRGLPAGAWVKGRGYDNNFMPGHAHPTRADLDPLFPDTPVLLSHASGHMGVVNTAGIKALGITADTPDPEGGKIGREADGRTPSGYLEENAFIRLTSSIPQPDFADSVRSLEEAQKVYFSNGITLIQDGLTSLRHYKLLTAAHLTADVVGYADMKTAPKLAGKPMIGGYKIFLDGSPQGRTAWMLEPYEEGPQGPGYRGYPIYSDEKVTAFVAAALREGRQILAHCNGDAACAQFIRACRCAQEAAGRSVRDIRPVMIHAQFVHREMLSEMAELGIIPSFFAAHLWHWGDVHVENMGQRRAEGISPLRSARELGLPFTLHQDTPVIQPNMLETVWCAVNRVTRKGAVLGPGERISPMEALRAVTVNAAYQYFMEDQRGSIAPGKRADFVILSADPAAVDPMAIRKIQVLETIKDGESVWRAGA